MKGILEFLLKNNRWAIILIILFIIIGNGVYKIQHNKINKLNEKYTSEVKLKNALTDSIKIYKDKENNWVVEKLTIQGRIDNLLEDSIRLTVSQRSLLKKVNAANKKNNVITAALIKANFIIDSLMNDSGIVDTINKTVEFIEDKNPDIKYELKIFGVQPYPPNIKPSLLIKKLELPNEQFIKFQWDENKRANYPISFSVTNTNKYINVYNIDSYAIPDLKKKNINPTGWEKFSGWINRNQNYLKWFGGGAIVGGGITYLLVK